MALPAGGGCSAHGLGALHIAFRIRRRIFPNRRCTPCQVIAGASASGQSRAAEGAGWTDIVAGEGQQYRRGTHYQCPRIESVGGANGADHVQRGFDEGDRLE
eukprot:scaffold2423_cov113-Isochrysis_galbana.AAC.15